MSPDDHVTFTAFERRNMPTVVTYGEANILRAVREYTLGHRDALERLLDAIDGFRQSRVSSSALHEAAEHARRILEAGR